MSAQVVDFPGEFHIPKIRMSEGLERLRDIMEMAESCATAMREAAEIIASEAPIADKRVNAMVAEAGDRLLADAEGWETFRALVRLQHSILEKEARK